ncbi:MAG: galactose oxidase-like domain-containing protein [Myxococcaceae bacterium]
MHQNKGRTAWRWATMAGMLFCGVATAHEEDEDTNIPNGPTLGHLSTFIPWHKDAIHISVVWPRTRDPQLCFWMRPSEWRGTDVVNPVPPMGDLRNEFRTLVYGGYSFSRTLEDSVRTRILPDLEMENTLCADYPGALVRSGKHHLEELTIEDFAENASAFHDSGHSKGLNYNLFCAGNVMLADGRIAVIGGHDKAGNHGIRKINIYDPETERWLPRPIPGAMEDYLADPTGLEFPHRTGLNEENTDPADPADMKYQRWYPSAVTLPNGKVLILSGSDQVSEVGPAQAGLTKVRQPTPEVYDPKTDRSIALENAQKLQNMYVRSFVVQTGHGKDDWKVLTVGEAVKPYPTGEALDDYDPWQYDGRTYLLDVQAALRDRYRHRPGERHWDQLATATSAHDSGAAVNLRYLDNHGMPTLQKIVAFGGSDQNGDTDVVETLDLVMGRRGIFTEGWRPEARLPFPLDQNNAVVLADGNIVVFGGSGRVNGQRNANLDVQLFNPATGQLTTVARTNVPRHDHSNGTLLPDGSVLISGGNRVDLAADGNVGVPVAQIYSPPYLFKGERPEVLYAPEKIRYGRTFDLQVHGTISKVTLLRVGPTTHNWSWGNAYVELAFKQKKDRVSVTAPKVPGAAVPGLYMLYVLNENGVPSVAQRVMVGDGRHGHGDDDHSHCDHDD